MLANGRAYWLNRTDNPSISDCFSLWYFAGLAISQNASGTVSKLRVVNCDFDAGIYGIFVDSSVTTGCTMQIANCASQTEASQANGIGLYVIGNNSYIEVSNYAASQCIQNAIRSDGTGNVLKLTNVRAVNWNLANTGFGAVEMATGNTADIVGKIRMIGGNGAAPYSGAGTINADLARGNFVGTLDGSGLVVVTHSAGVAPKNIILTLIAPDFLIVLRVHAVTATTFTVKGYQQNGTPQTGAIQFYWEAKL